MSENKSGGWNRPAANQPTAKRNAKAPSKVKGVVAGLVTVCALGGLCLWMFSGGEKAPEAKADKERGRIKEVAPAHAPKAKEPPKKVVSFKTNDTGRVMKYVDGKPAWMFPRKPPTKVVITNDTVNTHKSFEEKIFKNSADVQIAYLLTTRPGDMMIGEPESYYHNFKRSLTQALAEPIEVSPDDPDNVRLLKEDVGQVREELKKRMDAGEDVEKIMCESWEELRQVAVYREDLKREVEKLARDGDFSEKDAEELLGAANKMLEERGAKPLSMPGILRHKARVHALSQKGNVK